jgi:hypothetical protein
MPNTNNNPEPGNAGNPEGKPTIGVGHNMNRLRSSGASRHPHTAGERSAGADRQASKTEPHDTKPRQGLRGTGR